MTYKSVALIATPGGIGTFDEVCGGRVVLLLLLLVWWWWWWWWLVVAVVVVAAVVCVCVLEGGYRCPPRFTWLAQLFEVLTLLQTGKIKGFHKKTPIVLYGAEYWRKVRCARVCV